MKNLIILFLLVLSLTVSAQDKVPVSGTVTDATHQGIPGVTIMEKGTQQGTITDVNGKFKFNADPKAVLVFSFVGYQTQEIPIGGKTVFNVQLKEKVVGVDEVVVVGYGTSKKADLTGAIGTVNSSDITKQPAVDAAKSIQGKVSGVNIINSDKPGSSPSVIVRGLGTALGGRDPLYIVDGFPVDDISNISPSDIVSMDILKDASSASIYGVRAANGVIIITTKHGKKGKSKISVDSYFGVKGTLHQVKMANAQQYIEYFNENQASLGEDWTLSTDQDYDTDWFKKLTDVGYFNNNVVSISGGSENVDYFFSYNLYDEDGILKNQKYLRNTVRNNTTYKLFGDRLKLTQHFNLSFTKENPKPSSAFDEAYHQSPLVPVKYANGRYGQPFVNETTGKVTYESEDGETVGSLNSIGNPLFTVANTNELDRTVTLQGGLEAELKLTNWLTFHSRFGATKYFSRVRSYSDIESAWLNADPTRTEEEFEELKDENSGVTTYADNSLSITKEETFRWSWENFLSFSKVINKHHIQATLGASRERDGVGNTMGVVAYDVPSKSQYWNADMASDDYEKEISETSYTPTALASYFGRVQYNYANKYYLTATVRRDGSSTFKDSGDYWGTFPSVGAGWTISQENFFQRANLNFVDYLKLRASWGELGNQDVPMNVSEILTSTGSSDYNYVFGSDQDLAYGAAYGTPAVGLTWEITKEWSAGTDFTLLKSKLTGTFDYYHKTNTNAILYVSPTLDSEYADDYYGQGAVVVNRGIELSLNWKDKITDDLSYSIGGNFSHNHNEVTDVKSGYDGATGGSLGNGQITKRLEAGHSLYSWWMYEADGVWQNQDEIDENTHLGSPSPGYLRYKDQNDDGTIDQNDKKYFGSYVPTYNYGINLTINYKNYDLSVQGYGVGGNKIYNGLSGVRIDGGENISAKTYNERWTGDGSTNSHPGANHDSYASSYYLESGAYFRINNITLGYTLKNVVFNSSSLRVYLTAQNPFLFTHYSGFSPEVNTDDGDPSGTTGIELSAYPTTRNLVFGVNLKF